MTLESDLSPTKSLYFSAASDSSPVCGDHIVSTSDCGCLIYYCSLSVILCVGYYLSLLLYVEFCFCLSVIGFCLFLCYFLIGVVFLLADGWEVRGRWRWRAAYVFSSSYFLLRSPGDICSCRIRASSSSFLVPKCLFMRSNIYQVHAWWLDKYSKILSCFSQKLGWVQMTMGKRSQTCSW